MTELFSSASSTSLLYLLYLVLSVFMWYTTVYILKTSIKNTSRCTTYFILPREPTIKLKQSHSMSKLQKKKFRSLNGVSGDHQEPELIPLYKLIAGDKMVLISHSKRESWGCRNRVELGKECRYSHPSN